MGRREQYLDRLGIVRWTLRDATPVPESAAPVELPAQAGEAAPAARADAASWDELRAQVRDCTACGLHAGRTQTVFGVGNVDADWMIIGEAPGAEEDRQGEPFVGRAGKLLDAMLKAAGFDREQVYIANILKCRPPHNRDPQPLEVAACMGYLLRQLELVQPDLILAVGRIAAQNLLQTEAPIGKLRGVVHRFGDRRLPLVVTYHPAYLLRSPREKARAWQDLKLARSVLEASVAVSESASGTIVQS